MTEIYRELTNEFSCPTVYEPNQFTPKDVYDDIRELWAVRELGNDTYYAHFVVDEDDDSGLENKADFPSLHAYLKSFGITECLVHWWW